jgi:adenylate cyclase
VVETRAATSLSRYLSPGVVEAILKDPDRLRLGGERREITVLFADVVAFTKLAEQQQPEVVVQLLNELFTFATEIIQRRGGIIDKFIGDCVMAVWGAPEQRPDDPLRAVLAAEDLRRWLDTANRRWRKQLGLEIRLAMGINTGMAVAGNLGSEKRMDYTVIGDAVNVAARLEGKAAPGQILLSQATRDRLPKEFDLGRLKGLGESKLYGKASTLPVFEVGE